MTFDTLEIVFKNGDILIIEEESFSGIMCLGIEPDFVHFNKENLSKHKEVAKSVNFVQLMLNSSVNYTGTLKKSSDSLGHATDIFTRIKTKKDIIAFNLYDYGELQESYCVIWGNDESCEDENNLQTCRDITFGIMLEIGE